ncbi:PDR/VanB family oxidoreductase [Streptomyces sp. NPDC056716]|uniref:PDR/VanB family oxidoreductase n=1 Tax=unclassified Streptomyces TaxID=2593676 RepID=UPI00368668C2
MAASWVEAVVTGREMTTSRVVVLDLEPADGTLFPEHTAGAHIDVLCGPPGARDAPVRQYSLCGPPGDRARYRIAVLLDQRSRGGSLAVHGFHTGDRVRVSAPRSAFRLTEARRHVLFAGGIGITPLWAMAQHLDKTGGQYALHYCARSAADVAFADRLGAHPRVTVHLDDGPGTQRLDLRRDLGNPVVGTAVYVCGPGPFMDHVLDIAATLGWPQDTLHTERFVPAAPTGAEPGDGFTVRLATSGHTYHVAPHESILDVLLRNGVDAPHSCQLGICGECVVQVRAGDPDHRDDILTDDERARGLFTLCCSRARGPSIELAL